MPIDYDEFRRTTWDERIAIFSRLSPAEKAELFRSQVAGWLQRHSTELTSDQVQLLNEAIELAVPEMYVSPKPAHLVASLKEFEGRAKELLSPEQIIDALTMQWGVT